MAKRKSVNKSQQIRNYLQKHPNASPKQVAAALKRFGVSAAFVSTVKSQRASRSAGTKSRQPRQAGSTRNGATEPVVAAAHLIKMCGGVEQAKRALHTASQVAGVLS